MRKLIASVFCLSVLLGCSTDRSSILKVYNWGDYIDETVLPEFEQWYEEQTGEKISVVYQTFDINETMLSKIEKGHEDYDVVCPSDYIIERMLMNDLLLPIDRDFGDTPNYIDANLSPYIRHCFDLIDGKGKNANDYSVGYMWGTTGILYNTAYVADEDVTTWDVLRNPKYAGKLFVKDAARDVYGPVLIYLRQEQIRNGEVTLEDLMYDSSDRSISDVEEYMKQVKELVAGWEADFGKEQMTQERGWLNMTWSGDAMWAAVEGEDVGVELKYTVPNEGSNVWFDGWVIPKYAANVKAAKYFINFLSRPDIVIRNVDVIGYVSTSSAPEVLEAMMDDSYPPVNLTYFFGEEADSVCVHPILYPDQSVIDRCTMMHDWGDDTPKLIEMWARVKGTNATTFTYVLICLTLALYIYYRVSTRLRKRRIHKLT